MEETGAVLLENEDNEFIHSDYFQYYLEAVEFAKTLDLSDENSIELFKSKFPKCEHVLADLKTVRASEKFINAEKEVPLTGFLKTEVLYQELKNSEKLDYDEILQILLDFKSSVKKLEVCVQNCVLNLMEENSELKMQLGMKQQKEE